MSEPKRGKVTTGHFIDLRLCKSRINNCYMVICLQDGEGKSHNVFTLYNDQALINIMKSPESQKEFLETQVSQYRKQSQNVQRIVVTDLEVTQDFADWLDTTLTL